MWQLPIYASQNQCPFRALLLWGDPVSIDAINWCRDERGVRGPNKAVLHSICDRYNDEYGYAWPTISRIAKDSGWSDRTVSRCLRWLESRGYIATYRQFYAHDGSPASNRYYLPVFGGCPPRGSKFLVGGEFDFEGNWEADLDSEQDELIERYGQPDTT